jgi:hypothetical protein
MKLYAHPRFTSSQALRKAKTDNLTGSKLKEIRRALEE